MLNNTCKNVIFMFISTEPDCHRQKFFIIRSSFDYFVEKSNIQSGQPSSCGTLTAVYDNGVKFFQEFCFMLLTLFVRS